MMYRAGGVAAALSLAVSGGAYAATQMGDSNVKPLSESQARMAAIGAQGADVTTTESAGMVVEGQSDSVYTVTEETTEAHGSVEKETDSLPEGETRVETEGVDGVTRTTYEVTAQDGAVQRRGHREGRRGRSGRYRLRLAARLSEHRRRWRRHGGRPGGYRGRLIGGRRSCGQRFR